MPRAPVLGGVTLACPTDYSVVESDRRGRAVAADGTLMMSALGSGATRMFRLRWVLFTWAERAAINGAFQAARTALVAFVSPDDNDNTAYQVTADEAAELREETVVIRNGGGYAYRVEMVLREG